MFLENLTINKCYKGQKSDDYTGANVLHAVFVSKPSTCNSEAVQSICAGCFGGMVWIVVVPVLYSVVG